MQFDYDIFLSHASTDKFVARLVRRYFGSHNLYSWFDEKDMRRNGVFYDDDIRAEIKSAMEKCRNFIVLLSASSVSNSWVQEEIAMAKELLAQGRIEKIYCLVFDETKPEEIPEWDKSIEVHYLAGVFSKLDILTNIREEIGDRKPTYISNLEPNFLKQISLDGLKRNISKCDAADICIWYIDGGASFELFVVPGIREILRKNPSVVINCTVLLMDTEMLKTGRKRAFLNPRLRFQRSLDERISMSNFRANTRPHHELVEQSFELFQELQNEFENLKCTFLLSNQVPAGRFIFIGNVGFFGPCLARQEALLPMFVFDGSSPFYDSARACFDDAVKNGPTRRWTSRNVPKRL